jgi:hypothetical protein
MKAINDANAAMDATTAAAKEEIDRLQSCIGQLKKQLIDVETRSEATAKIIAFGLSLNFSQFLSEMYSNSELPFTSRPLPL